MKVMSFSSVCAAAMLALSCVAVEARPLIVGMTEQWLGGEEGREKSPRAGVEEAYAEAIRRGGNIPVVICRTAETGHLAQVLAPLDILILTGGADVEPSRYGRSLRRSSARCRRIAMRSISPSLRRRLRGNCR